MVGNNINCKTPEMNRVQVLMLLFYNLENAVQSFIRPADAKLIARVITRVIAKEIVKPIA
jgi:hypothetical protein